MKTVRLFSTHRRKILKSSSKHLLTVHSVLLSLHNGSPDLKYGTSFLTMCTYKRDERKEVGVI